MAETQRRPVPRDDSGELETAIAFLRFARESVLKKTDALDDEQLRRRLVETETTLLGLVQHLAVSERYWVGYHLGGTGSPDAFDWTMVVPDGTPGAEVVAEYRAAIADSDRIIETIGDPESTVIHPVDGESLTMRWVLAHLTSETVRHAGHADILREMLDGTTGR